MKIRCLSGNCISCSETSKWKNKFQDWTNESRNFKIDYITVYVGGSDYVSRDEGGFHNFVRSLSRLISGGSDEEFCRLNPDYC